MLGVIVALPIEARTLTRSPVPLGRAIDLGPQIKLVVTGMGRERALAGAERLHRAGATALLNWGCAAALRPGIAPGRLLVPAEFVLDGGRRIRAHEAWHQRLLQALAGLSPLPAPLAGTAAVLTTPAAKRALAESAQAVGADMESAFLAAWAEARRLPFAAVRAVADDADTVIPSAVAAATDASGQIAPWRLLGALGRHPGQIPALIRLGRRFGAARRTLERATARLLPKTFCRP